MSLEQSVDKLTAAVAAATAAIEAATGVLVTLAAAGKGGGPPPTTPPPAPRGRPPKNSAASPPPPAEPADEGLGDDGGLGDDDGGLGGDDATPAVSAEQAKAAVLAYRDKAIKLKGKEEGLAATRKLMKAHVAALEDIDDEKAAEVHKAFTDAIAKLK